MPIPDVGLTIRPRVDDSRSRKPLEDHAKKVREIEVSVLKLDKATKRHLDDTTKRWRTLGDVGRGAATGIASGFRATFSTLDRFNSVVDRAKAKLLDVRTIMTTGLLGAATFGGLSKILAAGRGNVETQARIRRQFSAGDAALLNAQAGRVGRLAGIDGADKYLIPIMEAVGETRAGTMFRGKKLSEAGAAKVRAQTFGTGASLFARLSTLAPEIPPEELARVLAEAGSGPGGVSRLANTLGLNRVMTRSLIGANAKRGGLAKYLGAADAKKYGVGKDIAGQGTMLEILLGKSGLTEEAAGEKRKGFDFQIKSIGAQLEGSIGTIGERAFNRLNEGLAKGGNLAEKLQSYLASERGQKMLDKVADTVSRIVGGMADLAEKIPTVLDFVDRHSGKLIGIGAAFFGARAYGQVSPLLKDAGGLVGRLLGGKAGGAIGALSDAQAMPVRVVNWGGGPGGGFPSGSRELDLGGASGGAKAVGLLRSNIGSIFSAGAGTIAAAASAVVASGVAGFMVGSWLDSKFSLSDRLAGTGGTSVADGLDKRFGVEGGGNKYASQQNEFSTAAAISRKVASGQITAREGAVQLARFAGSAEGVGSEYGGLSPFAQELVRRVGKGEAIDTSKGYGAISMAAGKAANVNVAISSPFLRDPAAFVDSIMPELRAQIVNQLQSESGYGAAPVSSPGM